MRNIWAICRRELLAFFVSPIAYFAITGFLLLAGYFFFNMLAMFSVMVQQAAAMAGMRQMAYLPNLNQWVVEPYYHTLLVILVFLVPVLTMRTVAEEKRRGTFELLITSPVTVGEIVWGKFLAVALVIFLMLLLSFSFPALLMIFGKPGPEAGPVLSGLGGLLLIAFSFASISMAVSSFTENQIVAAVSGMVSMLLLYVIHIPAESLEGKGAEILRYLSPVMQVQGMFRGDFSTSQVIYFISLIAVGLFFSNRALDLYRWR